MMCLCMAPFNLPMYILTISTREESGNYYLAPSLTWTVRLRGVSMYNENQQQQTEASNKVSTLRTILLKHFS